MEKHNEKQIKYDNMYMDLAKRISRMSYAVRLQVGAICVKDGRIISMGWNGTPANFDNCCENKVCMIDAPPSNVLVTKPEVIHAEQNAIFKLARDGESGKNSTMYCTHAPCTECSKGIIQTGIVRVVYAETYRVTDGIDLLHKAKIQVDKLPDP